MAFASGVVKRRRIGLLILLCATAIVLGVFTALGVRARAPRPAPEPTWTPTQSSVPATPWAVLSPQEAVEAGELIVVRGEGWRPGDEVFVELIAPSGNRRFVAKTTAADGSLTIPFFFPTESPWSAFPEVSVRVFSVATGEEALLVIRLVGATETPPPTPTAMATARPIETATPTTTPPAPPTETASPTAEPSVTPTPTSIAMPTATATSVPPLTGWRGEYYGNRFLTGDPAMVRHDAAVSFIWGSGAPAAGLPIDGFSARWSRTLAFPGGNYRFHAVSDDGVRVWLDGVLIIDQWHEAPSRSYAADRILTTGNHSLRVEYYENTGTAQIQVWWERMGDFPQWRGEYFPRADLIGAPALVRNDRAIDFDWGWSAPAVGVGADSFSARWTRSIWFDDALYRFHAVVDDGVRVYLDNALVIDAWRDGGRRELTAERGVLAGHHTVRVEYYERTGEAMIQVWWEELTTYPDWKGEYWSNRTLTGNPLLVRNDASIDFNWGWGSPAPTLPSADFSARWTRTMDFDAATYRFYVLVDDGVRLWVDDKLVIDSWRDGSLREVTGAHVLARGAHTVKVTYYEHGGEARIRVWWEKVGTSISDWRGEYWSNRRLEGQPSLVRNDEEIAFNWGKGAVAAGMPADDFSARWSRDVTFRAGVYRFRARSDDGIRVYLDGKRIIDEWHRSDGEQVYRLNRDLAGEHTLVVEYHEREGEARVSFSWERLGPLPTVTPTAEPTIPATATPTRTPTPTMTPTQSPTPTSSPQPTATFTPTPEPSVTPTTTPTASSTPTVPPTPTSTPTATPTPTMTPTMTPTSTPTTEPEVAVRLNEIMPAPREGDDQWIELFNSSATTVDLGGWFVDDGVGGSEPYIVPDGTIFQPGVFLLFYGSASGVVLDETGDEVRLIDPAGAVVDAVALRPLARNASYSRDEAGIWHDNWPPSPGTPNRPFVHVPLVDSERQGMSVTVPLSGSREMRRIGLHIR